MSNYFFQLDSLAVHELVLSALALHTVIFIKLHRLGPLGFAEQNLLWLAYCLITEHRKGVLLHSSRLAALENPLQPKDVEIYRDLLVRVKIFSVIEHLHCLFEEAVLVVAGLQLDHFQISYLGRGLWLLRFQVHVRFFNEGLESTLLCIAECHYEVETVPQQVRVVPHVFSKLLLAKGKNFRELKQPGLSHGLLVHCLVGAT